MHEDDRARHESALDVRGYARIIRALRVAAVHVPDDLQHAQRAGGGVDRRVARAVGRAKELHRAARRARHRLLGSGQLVVDGRGRQRRQQGVGPGVVADRTDLALAAWDPRPADKLLAHHEEGGPVAVPAQLAQGERSVWARAVVEGERDHVPAPRRAVDRHAHRDQSASARPAAPRHWAAPAATPPDRHHRRAVRPPRPRPEPAATAVPANAAPRRSAGPAATPRSPPRPARRRRASDRRSVMPAGGLSRLPQPPGTRRPHRRARQARRPPTSGDPCATPPTARAPSSPRAAHVRRARRRPAESRPHPGCPMGTVSTSRPPGRTWRRRVLSASRSARPLGSEPRPPLCALVVREPEVLDRRHRDRGVKRGPALVQLVQPRSHAAQAGMLDRIAARVHHGDRVSERCSATARSCSRLPRRPARARLAPAPTARERRTAARSTRSLTSNGATAPARCSTGTGGLNHSPPCAA